MTFDTREPAEAVEYEGRRVESVIERKLCKWARREHQAKRQMNEECSNLYSERRKQRSRERKKARREKRSMMSCWRSLHLFRKARLKTARQPMSVTYLKI